MNEYKQAVRDYLKAIAAVRSVGTPELSHYTALDNLFDAVGAQLKPRVRAVVHHQETGRKQPDLGLFSQNAGESPDRGVVEVKGITADLDELIDSEQVKDYWTEHQLVLATNLRQFALIGQDSAGQQAVLERYSLADSAEEFSELLARPQATASRRGVSLGEYLARIMEHRTTIAEPRELARLLASYARDALARVGDAEAETSLKPIREALEQALGMQFTGDDGKGFFRSTLVQTLFYGVFAAWVLWVRSQNDQDDQSDQRDQDDERFRWRDTVEYLQVPVLGVLFHQLTDPGTLKRLNLVDVLNWTEAALARVDSETFLARFEQGEAVQYFYEPFLEAFDPELRKQLGVWYTPREIVQYMVARVDRALRDDLGITHGLADQRVYVLDPCCGTGAFLVETLRRIARSPHGLGAGAGEALRLAAQTRVFGFEIMPAPLVVAHLQIGLALEQLDAGLKKDQHAGVFLTNALTGWKEEDAKQLPFLELEEERKQASEVKRQRRILVVLGNPPYNSFAGVAVDEERELTDAYREVHGDALPSPEGHGLNDLYVRFFRMAERRIAERTGEGVVCFISNYSWLDGLSFPGMRERYLDAFDVVRVDSLNGDKYRTGKLTPDGKPDPSVFSTEEDPVGIQVGTAIATLVRKREHAGTSEVGFRNLWGASKRADLLDSADSESNHLYESLSPVAGLGLPFTPTAVRDDWFKWPSLTDLFPAQFPGVKTSRDSFLVDIDQDALMARLADYFDASVAFGDLASRYPDVAKSTKRFDAPAVRNALLARGGPEASGFIRYAYRPFDVRWLYWERNTKLLDEKREEYRPHVFAGNVALVSQRKPRREWSPPQVISQLGCLDLMDRGASCIPLYLRDDQFGEQVDGVKRTPNLSELALRYIESISASPADLFHHALATLHDPAYREANAGGLRMGWPRIPLPDDRDALIASAERGRTLARLLDTESAAADLLNNKIAVPTKTDGSNMKDDDFKLTAGWGHYGANKAVMPGQGRIEDHGNTVNIHLNDHAYWSNIPKPVWQYRLGGYQVLKKYLSYRDHKVLARPLTLDEVSWFSEAARRIAAILEIVE